MMITNDILRELMGDFFTTSYIATTNKDMPTKPKRHKMEEYIKDVIYNPPATIIFWVDGTKTVVKCDVEDTYSMETGFLMCVAKKFFGNTGDFNEVLKKWCWDREDELKEQKNFWDKPENEPHELPFGVKLP